MRMPYGDKIAGAEYKAARNRARAEESRRRGLCTRCGKRPHMDGRAVCAECREKRRERYMRLNAEGKCPHCGGPRGDRYTLCFYCRVKVAECARLRRSAAEKSEG